MNAPTLAITAAQLEPAESRRSGSTSTYLLVPILLLFALLLIAVIRSPNLVSQVGIGSAIIVAGPLVLATMALMASTMAGRGTVDLSIGPLIGFINVTLIQFFGAGYLQTPVSFVLYAVVVGVLYQLLMALIVIYIRVQPIIVALSGYLALSGINLVILPRPGGIAPEWMQSWGAGTEIVSPVLIILLLAIAGWLLFTRSAFYLHLRLMGSDERAAYTSGVRITVVRIGAHVISGVFAALSAICFTALIGSGDPNQGTTYTLVAVTALVLGGASLAGGRGSVFGSLFGAMSLYLITYVLATFNFGSVQSFVTDLAYGTILVLSLLVTVVLPYFHGWLRYVSPLLFFVVLSVGTLGVILHVTFDYDALRAETLAGRTAPAADMASGLVRLGADPVAPAPAPEVSPPAGGEPPAQRQQTETFVLGGGEPAPARRDTNTYVLGGGARSAPERPATATPSPAPRTGLSISGASPPAAEAPAPAPAPRTGLSISGASPPAADAPAPAPAPRTGLSISGASRPAADAPAPAPAPRTGLSISGASPPAADTPDPAPAPRTGLSISGASPPAADAPAPAPAPAPRTGLSISGGTPPAEAPAPAPRTGLSISGGAPPAAEAPAPAPRTGLSISGAPATGGAPADDPAVLQPDPAPPPAPAAVAARGDAAVFLGERAVGGVDLPGYLKPLVFLAILLVAIPLLLRTLVTHSGRRASLTLPVFLVCAAIVLIGVYLARTQDRPDTAIGAPTPEAGP